MQYRRIRNDDSELAPLALLGLGVGVALGFLLGELYGRERTRRVTRAWAGRLKQARTPINSERLGAQLRAALAPALGAEAAGIDVIAVGRGAVELHGWVSSRRLRTKALAAARSAAGVDQPVIDRLLVRGEDDIPALRGTFPDESSEA